MNIRVKVDQLLGKPVIEQDQKLSAGNLKVRRHKKLTDLARSHGSNSKSFSDDEDHPEGKSHFTFKTQKDRDIAHDDMKSDYPEHKYEKSGKTALTVYHNKGDAS